MAGFEARRMADQLDRAVNGPAWHGPSMRDVLKGVSARQAAGRPVPGAHSIWELVVHATAWIDIVRQRIEGTAPKRITSTMNWPPMGPTGSSDWRRAVSRLRRGAARLGTTIRALDDRHLADSLQEVDDTWSVYVTVHGVIEHTLYHAGQIALLRKQPGETRP